MAYNATQLEQLILKMQGLEGQTLTRDQRTGLKNAVGTLGAYQGMLGNPSLGPAGAANAAQMLGSLMPEPRQMGQTMLGNYMAGRGQVPMRDAQLAAAEQGLKLGEQSLASGVQTMEQDRQMFPLQMAGAQANIEQSRASTALSRFQLGQAQTQAQFRPPPTVAETYELMTGSKVPNGFTPEDGPMGIRLRPLDGTDAHKAGVKSLRTAEAAYQLANEYADLAEEVGAETWPTEAKGEARFMHGRIVSMLAEMASTGVVSPTEVPRLSAMVPSIADKYVWTQGDSAAMEAFVRELENAVLTAREANWFIQPKVKVPGEQ